MGLKKKNAPQFCNCEKHAEWCSNRGQSETAKEIIHAKPTLSRFACKILWAAMRQMQDCVLNTVLLGGKRKNLTTCYIFVQHVNSHSLVCAIQKVLF